MARQLSHRERKSLLTTYDLVRTAPEFTDEGANEREDVHRFTNAYPETEYEDMRRLSPVAHFDFDSDSMTLTKPGLSPRVRAQVLGQIGQRTGTMTFSSLLEPVRDDDERNAARGAL